MPAARQTTTQHLLAMYEREYQRQREQMIRHLELIESKPPKSAYNHLTAKGRARRS